jgi:hypothetical protein
VEVNGKIIDQTKRTENSAAILNLIPGTLYDVRVFTVSATRFQTPSALLHVRTLLNSQPPSQDETNDGALCIRAYASKSSAPPTPPSAPLMTREHSGGPPISRRGTNVRRPSPACLPQEAAGGTAEEGQKHTDDEADGNLALLSERFQKAQHDSDTIENQIVEEERDFEVSFRELERRRDELKQALKERDEASSDLRKQVHKMETANRTAQSEKSKKERLLQQKESQRKKRREEMARWEDQISSMTDEMAGIETQKAAIERRTQSELREIRQKIEEEQRDVNLLDEDNKVKALQIKALEEERKQLNVEDETDESREDDRLEFEKDARWRQKLDELSRYYAGLYQQLQQAKYECNVARERLAWFENTRRASAVSFASIPPLDMDAIRRGGKLPRRPRHGGSLTSSISSPRATFPAEVYVPTSTLLGVTNVSPTTIGPALFNPQNLMTIRSDSPAMAEDELDTPDGVPMSPRADSLLPADLLGDESADDMLEEEITMPTKPIATNSSTIPFPPLRTSSLLEGITIPGSPSPVSSSSRSFSSPRESFTGMRYDPERRSLQSGHASIDLSSSVDSNQAGSRKLMSNIFSFNRQRGKTMADGPPPLGTLKLVQSNSFPRNFGDDFDPASQRRRRLSYGGNWAIPGNLIPRASLGNSGKEAGTSRLSSGRRAFPGFFSGIGKLSATTFDPFAAPTDSFDADIRVESSSPRPSSTYSFDKMPRPSLESQFRAWAPERSALRGSPLAPDWASFHSFSGDPSRRPSIHIGSTSNLSTRAPPGDEDFLQAGRESQRPLQAPIGTRPASAQRPATPKLNPAAPSFTTLFSKRAEKNKEKAKSKELDRSKALENVDDASPPDSRKSKETPSIAATGSTLESRDSLERSTSAQSAGAPLETTPAKPTFISKITRKASSNKFGSWKDKGGLFSRKEPSTSNAELEEDTVSAIEQLGKSLESTSTTPSGEEKKVSRTSLTWSFRRKSKKGGLKEDLAASEVSENSEMASEVGTEDGDDDG